MRNIITLILTMLFYAHLSVQAGPHLYPESIGSNKKPEKGPGTDLLLSRIDLENPELVKVKQTAGNDNKSAIQLLNYYKSRKSVNHFIDRSTKKSKKGNSASGGDFRMADNALKHIFVGQSAYPPYFCGDDINWGTRPVPDNEWVWQLNRMYFWDALARVYWHTGDEKYAREWCTQLIDWTRKNPNDADHNYAWRSIEAGIRGHSWTELFQQFIDSPSFTPEVLVAFLNSCYDHAEYLMTKYSSRSNWGLMEAEGMAFIALTFPEFKEANKWRTEAFRRLNNEINLQIYPDGQQRELAMGYHLGCIEWFLRTYELAKMNGIENTFPESYLQKIQKMCEVPMKLCHPDGRIAQFGDAWTGEPGQHNGMFLEWSEKFNRPDFLFLATDGREGVKPEATAFVLNESGFYSLRSGWTRDAICLVLKCGPDGGGHCQPDNGTFELYAGGRILMPDAGSYIYNGDPEGRAWFRQTKVHQTLTLDGQNSRYAPRLVLWKPGDNLDILVVENESYPGFIHRRSVFFVDKSYFVIVDEAKSEKTGDVDIHFQLAPGDAVFNIEKQMVRSDFKDGWNVMVQSFDQDGMKPEKEEGQVSFRYTKKEPRPAFRYRIRKTEPGKTVRFATLVIPYQGETPSTEIKKFDFAGPSEKSLSIEILKDNKIRTISYTLD
jgi:heparan-sulfate lyase